jgi:Ca2+-binding EF-hand superfamily protein
MINMFDRDKSGTVTFDEFSALWKYVVDWQQCFRGFDRDNSGNIDGAELRHALTTFGYRFQVKPSYSSSITCDFYLFNSGEMKGRV